MAFNLYVNACVIIAAFMTTVSNVFSGAMTFSIMTLSIIDLIVTLSVKGNQHNDTQHEH